MTPQIIITRGDGGDFWIRTVIGNKLCDRRYTIATQPDGLVGKVIEVSMALVEEVTKQQQEQLCKSASA